MTLLSPLFIKFSTLSKLCCRLKQTSSAALITVNKSITHLFTYLFVEHNIIEFKLRFRIRINGRKKEAFHPYIFKIISFFLTLFKNESIQSFKAGVYFFLTQLLLKIPVFELKNCFLFHRT